MIWALIIFGFSGMPAKAVSGVYWQEFAIKKTIHIVEYGTLSLLIYRAFIGSGVKKEKAAVLAILISVVYAISDEFHQSFTPGREPTVRDVLFDTIGAVLAILIIWKLLPLAPKRLRILAERYQLT
jgi:VanZ family protein